MNRRFQTGEIIGEYRIQGFLGEGGMGVVYHGVHLKLGRPAAIKVLGSATVSDQSFKTRFFNEARLQAALHHPHIAALYDFQEAGDQLFIFMEFVDGESLEDLIARRAFAIEDALRVFAQICEAVAYIHRNGIVHRDIKSQNVKLTSAGMVKMLDFGIAKDSSSHGLTQTGGVIGTPHYLAPEQLSGQPAAPQSDVWALGVLLYEMLTGALPFSGETLGTLVHQITTAEFKAPEAINPAVSREVANVVKRCLKKETSKRFQTADQLLDAVNGVLHKKASSKATFFGSQPQSEPAAAPAPFVSGVSSNAAPAKKLPVLGIAVASAAAVLLLFAVVGVWLLVRSSGNPAKPTVALADAVNKNGTGTQTTARGAARKVRVDVDEGQAQVIRGGQTLGTTPYDLDAADGEKIDLTLRREGYEDKTVQIDATGTKKVYTFSLKRK